MTEKGLVREDRVRFGIISFAHMHAASYARALNEIPGAELIGIYDNNRDRGLSAAATYNTDYYQCLRDLLDTDIHAVIVMILKTQGTEMNVFRQTKAGKHVHM